MIFTSYYNNIIVNEIEILQFYLKDLTAVFNHLVHGTTSYELTLSQAVGGIYLLQNKNSYTQTSCAYIFYTFLVK